MLSQTTFVHMSMWNWSDSLCEDSERLIEKGKKNNRNEKVDDSWRRAEPNSTD